MFALQSALEESFDRQEAERAQEAERTLRLEARAATAEEVLAELRQEERKRELAPVQTAASTQVDDTDRTVHSADHFGEPERTRLSGSQDKLERLEADNMQLRAQLAVALQAQQSSRATSAEPKDPEPRKRARARTEDSVASVSPSDTCPTPFETREGWGLRDVEVRTTSGDSQAEAREAVHRMNERLHQIEDELCRARSSRAPLVQQELRQLQGNGARTASFTRAEAAARAGAATHQADHSDASEQLSAISARALRVQGELRDARGISHAQPARVVKRDCNAQGMNRKLASIGARAETVHEALRAARGHARGSVQQTRATNADAFRSRQLTAAKQLKGLRGEFGQSGLEQLQQEFAKLCAEETHAAREEELERQRAEWRKSLSPQERSPTWKFSVHDRRGSTFPRGERFRDPGPTHRSIRRGHPVSWHLEGTQ